MRLVDSRVPKDALFSLLLALCAMFSSNCSGSPSTGREGERVRLSIRGSDTMVILAQRWAEEFMARHRGVVLEVSGGGTGTGLAALRNGTTDIATASRELSARERAEMPDVVETKVALDAVAIYVNAGNPIRALNLDDLSRVYRGDIDSWLELGGEDRELVLYSRENSSGTYAYFKERVLDGHDFASLTQMLPGTAAVIEAVAHDVEGIGYGGIGYARNVRVLAIRDSSGAAIEPSPENATSGRYPLSRHLFMITRGRPHAIAREFLDFVQSDDARDAIVRAGFFPVPR